jgi:hypothetical protein
MRSIGEEEECVTSHTHNARLTKQKQLPLPWYYAEQGPNDLLREEMLHFFNVTSSLAIAGEGSIFPTVTTTSPAWNAPSTVTTTLRVSTRR